MPPPWLSVLVLVWLGGAVACALALTADLLRHRPPLMPVMYLVWPITALYMGPIAVWAYWTMDRLPRPQGLTSRPEEHGGAHRPGPRQDPPGAVPAMAAHGPHAKGRQQPQPFWQAVFKGTTHCGAGCTLGDLLAEWLIFLAAWQIAGRALWPEYLSDYTLAYLLGIAFQYFTIAPMRGLGLKQGLWAAVQADTLALTAFELGLFAWMALMAFVFFHPALHPDHVVYWFLMQVGMLVGFATSYPMNWWLLRRGLKEPM